MPISTLRNFLLAKNDSFGGEFVMSNFDLVINPHLNNLMKLVGDEGLGHVPRPRNLVYENKFSREDFLANCHWQFSPPTSSVGEPSP